MVGDRMRYVLLAVVVGGLVLVGWGLFYGGRVVYRAVRGSEAEPTATAVAEAQTPVPTPTETEWGSEKFPTFTPTPTMTPTPTSTPVLTGVDAFGFSQGYRPEVAEGIRDLKKLAPPVTAGAPTAPGLDVVEEVLKSGKELVEQVGGPAVTPTLEPTAAPIRQCRFWKFGCKDVTPTPAPTPTPMPGWVEELFPGLMDKAGEKAAEVWQAIVGPTPTPTPQPRGGIAGTGIPLWALLGVVVVIGLVVFVLRFVSFEYVEEEPNH